MFKAKKELNEDTRNILDIHCYHKGTKNEEPDEEGQEEAKGIRLIGDNRNNRENGQKWGRSQDLRTSKISFKAFFAIFKMLDKRR